MNETIIGYILIVIMSVIAGICGTAVYTERKSAKDFRERISDNVPNSGELEGSKQRFEDTIAEIRKNQQTDE